MKNYEPNLYEDIVRDPVSSIKTLSEFWGLNLSDSSIRVAVEKCTKEQMAKRISRKNGQQIHESHCKKNLFSQKQALNS